MAVRHQHTLRRPGRARREHDHAGVAVGYLDLYVVRRSEQQFVEVPDFYVLEAWNVVRRQRAARHVYRPQIGYGILDIGEPGQEFALYDTEPRLGIGQYMGEERALIGGVDADMDRADAAQPDPGPETLQPVVEHDRDGFAERHADPGEGISDNIAPGVEFGVAQRRPVLELDEPLAAARARLFRQYFSDDPIGFVDCHG